MALRKPQAALRLLEAARRSCRIALNPTLAPRGKWDDYRDYGMYGDTYENLKEIEQRIRWVKAGDYDHALLYRPYDFDLQVPPYRLGVAGP
jgi:hypothetical protein